MNKTKSFEISKSLVWRAWQQVKANKGSAGVDQVSIEDYEKNLSNNLYRLWNRMCSGSYFPSSVRLVEIPKSSGGKRTLGIPTVDDCIAQGVLAAALEPEVESVFHEDSYGFRPGRSAHDAVETARIRCLQRPWVIDLDIEKFFDTVDHELLLRAVRKHQTGKWMELYVRRWLCAPAVNSEGQSMARDRGTPQGGVASPVLANLFLHYVFDRWVEKHLPIVKFERYVDDIIIHCFTRKQAEYILSRVKQRFTECGLVIHPGKTKIVYCRKEGRNDQTKGCSFDFLGFDFRPRMGPSIRTDGIYLGFTPAISKKSRKKITRAVKSWQLRKYVSLNLKDLAVRINPIVRGWFAYYGKFYPSLCARALLVINFHLVKWLRQKFKRYKGHRTRAAMALQAIYKREPRLFYHWTIGATP